jgi:hypothetical protein
MHWTAASIASSVLPTPSTSVPDGIVITGLISIVVVVVVVVVVV